MGQQVILIPDRTVNLLWFQTILEVDIKVNKIAVFNSTIIIIILLVGLSASYNGRKSFPGYAECCANQTSFPLKHA